MDEEFKIVFKEKYSENIYIQYDSTIFYQNLGKNVEESRMLFEKFAEKVCNGEIYIVLPSEKGLSLMMSQNQALCITFDNENQDVSIDNYLQLLDEQNAIGYIIEFKTELILCSISKSKLEKIENIAYNAYVKKMKKEPENIYIKLSSDGANNIITNHEPDSDVMMYFYNINYEKKNISNKVNTLKEQLLKMNPELEINFDYIMDNVLEYNSEDYFVKETQNDEKKIMDELVQEEENIQNEELQLEKENNNEDDLEENQYYEQLFNDLSKQNDQYYETSDEINDSEYIMTEIHE